MGGIHPVKGSIPACAGEPSTKAAAIPRAVVYPRVCGGTQGDGLKGDLARGLSPRVRGNLWGESRWPICSGSIPACAGEPPLPPLVGGKYGVYPRVCGGTQMVARLWTPEQGLSPRVRGNRGVDPGPGVGGRSIPACAGEPPSVCGWTSLSRVYPRVCGGTTVGFQQSVVHRGLSPRVRGNRAPPDARRKCTGSIPACAGEPGAGSGAGAGAGVYPRVCGGTMYSIRSRTAVLGLSPRVRGNRQPSIRRSASVSILS